MAEHCCCNFVCSTLTIYGFGLLTNNINNAIKDRADKLARTDNKAGKFALYIIDNLYILRIFMAADFLISLWLIFSCDGKPPECKFVFLILLIPLCAVPLLWLLAYIYIWCCFGRKIFYVNNNKFNIVLLHPFLAFDNGVKEYISDTTAHDTLSSWENATTCPIDTVLSNGQREPEVPTVSAKYDEVFTPLGVEIQKKHTRHHH